MSYQIGCHAKRRSKIQHDTPHEPLNPDRDVEQPLAQGRRCAAAQAMSAAWPRGCARTHSAFPDSLSRSPCRAAMLVLEGARTGSSETHG